MKLRVPVGSVQQPAETAGRTGKLLACSDFDHKTTNNFCLQPQPDYWMRCMCWMANQQQQAGDGSAKGARRETANATRSRRTKRRQAARCRPREKRKGHERAIDTRCLLTGGMRVR